MKLFTVLTLLILSLLSRAQIPNYFENNPSWNCGESPSGGFASYNYYLNGNDTVIGVHTYHQLWKKGYSSFSSDFNNLILLVRQDGNSIRYYNNNSNSDELLSDYNIQIGDSLKHLHHDVQADFDTLTVQKIDSIMVGSEFRKQFYFDTLNAGVIITEGIGFQIYEDFIEGEFIRPIGIAFGTGYGLHCYGKNAIPLWYADTNDTTSCELDITVSFTEFKTSQIKLFPNPATNEISISALNEIQIITLTSSDGKECLTVKGNTADVSKLRRGLYIVNIRFINGTSMRKSLILE